MLETEINTASCDEVQPFDYEHLPAVERCIAAHNYCHNIAPQRGSDYDVDAAAAKAYRDAMPDPSTRENIIDFLACVNYALMNGIITPRQASQHIRIAQIALALFRKEPDKGNTAPEKEPLIPVI